MTEFESSRIRQLAIKAREHRMRQGIEELQDRLKTFRNTMAAIQGSRTDESGTADSGLDSGDMDEPDAEEMVQEHAIPSRRDAT